MVAGRKRVRWQSIRHAPVTSLEQATRDLPEFRETQSPRWCTWLNSRNSSGTCHFQVEWLRYTDVINRSFHLTASLCDPCQPRRSRAIFCDARRALFLTGVHVSRDDDAFKSVNDQYLEPENYLPVVLTLDLCIFARALHFRFERKASPPLVRSRGTTEGLLSLFSHQLSPE